jgi:hypothetical protein
MLVDHDKLVQEYKSWVQTSTKPKMSQTVLKFDGFVFRKRLRKKLLNHCRNSPPKGPSEEENINGTIRQKVYLP